MSVAFNKRECELCGKQKPLGQTRQINVKHHEWLKGQRSDVDVNGYLCSKCLTLFYKNKSYNVSEDTHQSFVVLPYPRAGLSNARCFICKNKGRGMTTVPVEAATDMFLKHGILIPIGVICCKKHLLNKKFKSDVSINLSSFRNKTTAVWEEEVVQLLKDIRSVVNKTTNNRINFDHDDMTDDDMRNFTGITKTQFDDLVSHVKSFKKSKHRSLRQAVGVLLLKLRSGLSQRMICTICCVQKQFQVSRMIQSAKRALMENFVPHNVGFNALSSSDLIEKHTSDFAIQLFSNFISDSVSLILDGTYVYIQKSSRNSLQRRCFSMHRYRPLIKPMMITSTTGYIVSIIGPFYANGKNNDAAMTINMLLTNTDNIRDWLQDDDILILDRDFRDALPFLKKCGFHVKSPSFLPKSTKHLSTKEANESRLVTKIRWAVESVKWKIKEMEIFLSSCA